MFSMSWRKAMWFLLCAALALSNGSVCFARQTAEVQSAAVEDAPLSVEEIVSRMEKRNQERASALHQYEGTRIYRIHYRGFFGSHDAEMVVGVKAFSSEKQFTVESESGSKYIIDHVLKKLLDGEKEAATDEARRRTALSSANYDFTLAGLEKSSANPEYVLDVVPRTGDKFLYRGKIWVDSKDFAVTRIEAEPAKNPSMWIKKTEINHKYEKFGDFWLPAENQTDSWIRFGGHALLSIEYREYRTIEAAPPAAEPSVAYNPAGTAGH